MLLHESNVSTIHVLPPQACLLFLLLHFLMEGAAAASFFSSSDGLARDRMTSGGMNCIREEALQADGKFLCAPVFAQQFPDVSPSPLYPSCYFAHLFTQAYVHLMSDTSLCISTSLLTFCLSFGNRERAR